MPVARIWLLVAAVGVVAVLLLSPFAEARPPMSYDAPYYVWRTRLVAADGVDALTDLPRGAVPNPDRSGFPVVGAILTTLTRFDALTLVVVLRAAAAISIGAAAAAFAKESLGEPAWSWPWFVVGVGGSAAVVGAAIGSLDQLVVEVLFMGTAALVPLAARGRPGTTAAALLLAAAAVTHWIFTGLFLVLLLAVAAVLAVLPSHPGVDTEPSSRDATRVLRLTAIGAAAAFAVFLLLSALPMRFPEVVGEKGNLTRLGSYELVIMLPLAALGAVLALRDPRRSRRTGIVVMTVWAASVPFAMVASAILPTSLKLFRIAPFALGIPVLATVAVVTLARLASARSGTVGRVASVVLLVGGLVLVLGTPAATFDADYGASVTARMEQAELAGRYVSARARGRPVVFTTRDDPRLIDRVVRSWMPAALIADTWVYVGTPGDLATGGPVSDPDRPVLSRRSHDWWRRGWTGPASVLEGDPLVIDLGAPDAEPPPGFVELAPGLSVAAGSTTVDDGPSSIGSTWGELLLGLGVVILALAVVGGGWARALLDVPALSAALLAPVFGFAVLILVGVASGRVGVPVGGGGAVAIAAAAGGAGWVLSIRKRAR